MFIVNKSYELKKVHELSNLRKPISEAELEEQEERQKIASVQEEASSFNIEEWDDIQARVEADEEFAQRLQTEEREMYIEAEKARLLAELINERKRYFAA
ncbi:hypothetical protein Tco_0066217 [Tanacetum coccineum]